MTESDKSLSFTTLRTANRERIPEFRNSRGGAAHSKPDGSDWSPAQWLQALIGELGEYARVRQQYEAGELSYEEFEVEAKKELADVQCYLDLLALRALDKTTPSTGADPAGALQSFIAELGEYANWRKKYERGDIDQDRFVDEGLSKLETSTKQMGAMHVPQGQPAQVTQAHPQGVDLGKVTRDKFNEVSRRVGAQIFIDGDTVERHHTSGR